MIIWNHVKKRPIEGIQRTTGGLLNRGDTPHICNIQGSNASVVYLHVVGSFRKRRKTLTTEMNTFLSEKIFDKKFTLSKKLRARSNVDTENFRASGFNRKSVSN